MSETLRHWLGVLAWGAVEPPPRMEGRVVVAWVLTGLYVVAVGFSAPSAWRARDAFLWGDERAWDPFLFWLLISGSMALLCLGKQLDLNLAFTIEGRELAKAQGWYPYRRLIQGAFVLALVLLGAVAVARLRGMAGRAGRGARSALTGAAVLVCLGMARTVSWHQLDGVLAGSRYGVSLAAAIEMLGVLAVVAGAAVALTSGLGPAAPSPRGVRGRARRVRGARR